MSSAACANPVACENALPGAPPSTWQIDGSGDPTIQGYATSMSTNVGGAVSFKIKSATSNYRIDILRLGYYGGDGARLIASGLTPTGTSTQPACQTFSDSGLIDCGNWSVSRTWAVPSTAVPGVYIAHLVRNDTGGSSQIMFVVRDDSSHAAINVQTSDASWTAYNTYGGNSLYTCSVACPPGNPSTYKAAYKVSYNRPSTIAVDDGGRTSMFTGGEYPMIRFLERNGYDLNYVSSADVARSPSLLLNHKIFMSSGHDEYWSASQRSAIEAARDAGVSLAFFTGNEMFWKTRWEPSADGANTSYRTLVSYKDTHFTARQDPVEWTGTWRDSRFTTASDGVTPENALTGQSFVVNTGTSRITVPYAYRQLRLWRNTAAANLTAGQTLQLAPDTLGYEWDVDADNGFRPAGAFKVSATTVSGVESFTDYGSSTAANTTQTHNMTMYRAPSGALVFGAGTVQWAWGLDDSNYPGNAPDRNMQQATENLLADMGAQPATRQSDLSAASASTDQTAPTSTIASLPATVADGAQLTVSGSASDAGGGVVAGVEVSTDGGSTWHPATGTSSWTYTWTAHGAPGTTVRTRAVDDSGNLETPGAGRAVAITCPCSLWGTSTAPPATDVDSGDTSGVEVGVKFKSDSFGSVTGIRFYKAAANTGTHVGSLWTADGQRLAQATFTNETASGWQTVTFPTPIQVTPGTTYVASYLAPSGHYSATSAYFYRSPSPGPNGGAVADAAPLHALRNTGTDTNGAYSYTGTSTFPASSFGAANYWVDVLLTPIPAPGQVSDVGATAGGRTSANLSWTAPATGGAVTSYKITPYIGSAAQTPKTITGSPPLTSATVTGLTTGTTYTFTVQAVNPTGGGPASAQSGPVTPLNPVAPSVPTSVDAQPATTSARVTWNTPQADGDSPITGYTITPYIGSAAQPSVAAGATATTKTVTGLTNGSAYTFTVAATNAAGTSPESIASRRVTPQATILDFATPANVDSGDTIPVELGTKFKADSDGTITGIRFYKAAANTGTHVGSLWTVSGTRLGQATFTNETASGWQDVSFATPVAITAGTTYVASYYAPAGHYSYEGGGFAGGVDNGLLHALSNSTSANGVYSYGATSTFPSNTYGATNYSVDVLYAVPPPGQATGVTAAEAGRTSADVAWAAPSSGGPVTSYEVTPYVGTTAQTPTIVSGSPVPTSKKITGLTTGTTYTFGVRALNANGPGPASARSNAVTPQAPVAPSAPTGVQARPATRSALVTWNTPNSDGDSPITGYTVTPYIGSSAQTPTQLGASGTSKTITGLTNGTAYTFKVVATNAVGTGAASGASAATTPEATILDFAAPGTADSGDTTPVELGVKFKTDFAGAVTGIRFYKASANTGTHVGSLWTAGGTRLAQATFSSETSSGWQHATFSSPVSITPGTTYVASYFAPNGHYSVNGGGLASGVDNAPLHALADSTSANGVYAYGSSGFPSSSYGASNYSVDVLFDPAGAPGTVTGVTATAGKASAAVSWSAPSTGGPVTSYDITPYVGSAAQATTTLSGTPPATTRTITGLTPGTAYTFRVTASNPSGAGPQSAASSPVTPTGAVAPDPPTGAAATANTKSAVVSWTAPADDGGSAITGYTVTPYDGTNAGTPAQAGASATSARVTGLTNGTSYTFRVAATNAAGTGTASGTSNAVVPLDSIFEFSTPVISDAGDAGSVVLGVKFTSDVAGSIAGIRFYKAATNTGTHVGALWSAAGQRLGQGTFSGESDSGWQTLLFTTPVAITANTTYVASYLAPNGHYSVSGAFFAPGPFDNTPLHAVADPVSPNGVYTYSSASVFPDNSWNATNYSVDVLFSPGG